MKRIRTFIALDLPRELKDKIAQLVEKLDEKLTKDVQVNWVNPQKAHITLVFLGHISLQRVEDATTALRKTVEVAQKFELQTGGLSYFFSEKGSSRSSTIFFDIPDTEKNIRELYKALFDNLAAEGFFPPTRLVPHITLGRLGKLEREQNREEILSEIIDFPTEHTIFLANKVNVYESLQENRGGKLRYHLLRSFELK